MTSVLMGVMDYLDLESDETARDTEETVLQTLSRIPAPELYELWTYVCGIEYGLYKSGFEWAEEANVCKKRCEEIKDMIKYEQEARYMGRR